MTGQMFILLTREQQDFLHEMLLKHSYMPSYMAPVMRRLAQSLEEAKGPGDNSRTSSSTDSQHSKASKIEWLKRLDEAGFSDWTVDELSCALNMPHSILSSKALELLS